MLETLLPVDLVSFAMPSLGADMDEGTIVEWRIASGAAVHRGDIVAIVETDKSDLDVEVFIDGTVIELLVPEGVKVPVGTPLATISPASPDQSPRPLLEPEPVPMPVSAPPVSAPPVPVPTVPTPTMAGVQSHLDSPMLRHLAERLHVDTAHLAGTGPGGRITRDDLEHAATRPRITPRARRLAREHRVDLSTLVSGGVVTGDHVLRAEPGPRASNTAPEMGRAESMRRSIARLMTTAWREIPHYQVASRIDLQRPLLALAERNAEHGLASRVLPAALLVRAAARAAAEVPGVNGHWLDDRFVPAGAVDIAVVVALRSGGLLAPVIRDAANKDLDAVMSELRDLVTRARTGRLRASEIGGATITVTELGDGGVDTVAPIIHPPQVAILGLGAIHDEAWADEGSVSVRPVVHATLAGDHRAIDGRLGSMYLTAFRRILQEPLAP